MKGSRVADQSARRCAVVFNPVKVADDFREIVSQRFSEAGWSEPMWLETTEDDPGRSMTATAREAGVDLVLAAGGDGTVRVVADGLAGSQITMAIRRRVRPTCSPSIWASPARWTRRWTWRSPATPRPST